MNSCHYLITHEYFNQKGIQQQAMEISRVVESGKLQNKISVLYFAFVLNWPLSIAILRRAKWRMMSTIHVPGNRAEHAVRLSWIFFGSTFVALILNGVWSLIVGTASPAGDEEDLVQGWEGVLRNIPAYLLLISVAALSVWFATQGGKRGSQRARSALVASSLVLLFAMSSVTRDATEVVMTTRAATITWLMFSCDAVLVALVFFVARQRINRASGR